MMKLKSTIILSFLAFVVASCENRLDIQEHGVTPRENFYKTDSEIEGAVASIYVNLRSYTHIAWELKNWLSDDFWCGGGSHWNSSTGYRTCDYTFGSDNADFASMFKDLYQTVYSANVVLENVRDGSSVGRQAIAEAHVLRAFAYFELTTMWGTPPLVNHTLKRGEYSQANTPTDSLWQFIENDLKTATNSNALPEKKTVDEINYHATLQFAEALLGKAYLYQKKYAEALPMFDAVINSGKYELYKDYNNLMTMSADGNSENVFEINIPYDRNNKDSVTGADLTWVMFGVQTRNFDIAHSTTDISSRGWGFFNPTRNLYNAFVTDNGVDGYRLHCTLKTLQQFRDEDSVTCSLSPILDHEGIVDYKFRFLNNEMEPNAHWGVQSAKNYRVMRLADVLLMAAESALQTGNENKALEYVNRVRSRAKSPLLTTVSMDDIKKERRLELFGEMVRWQDLIRWGDAAKVLKDKGRYSPDWNIELIKDSDGNVTGYGEESETLNEINDPENCGFKPRHWLLPFPAEEVSVNRNLKQNPGW